MQAIKFSFVDFMKSRLQVIIFLVMAAWNLWLMKISDSSLSVIYYIYFFAVVISIQPFVQEQTAEVGFVNMLPGSKKNRVVGRYFYGFMLQIAAFILSWIDLGIYSIFFQKIPRLAIVATLGCLGIGLIFYSIQYTIFYMLGKIKSQQLAGIIMMTPGFIMLFGLSYFLKMINQYTELDMQWFANHSLLGSTAILFSGSIICIVSMTISAFIVEKKDTI
ncbi:ABC-2 family transporter [Lachnotalea glycerini]|uniref:ABC-2 family transporter n=1 Tax=Lachnotalea glycerini TaxID=1763509 RepID=A0A318ETR2_9FIRM|nr:ABC-2 transporter permease [Lachnotalea glycerini]PXV91590.1 ABC-2 family transporter [Lachnotalea glycerini]